MSYLRRQTPRKLKEGTLKLLNLSSQFRSHYPRGKAGKDRNKVADSLRKYRDSDRVRSYVINTGSRMTKALAGNQPLLPKRK